MTARYWLEINYRSGVELRDVRPLSYNSAIGIADGACPGCKSEPFEVQGSNLRFHDNQTYVANGRCRQCGDAVGYLFAEADTLFGLEEDRNVLIMGRARVY
jgi:hypothetical protein